MWERELIEKGVFPSVSFLCCVASLGEPGEGIAKGNGSHPGFASASCNELAWDKRAGAAPNR